MLSSFMLDHADKGKMLETLEKVEKKKNELPESMELSSGPR